MATPTNSQGLRLTEPVTPGGTTELRRAFREFDLNGDGSISKTELADVIKVLGSTATQEEVDDMISKVDRDGNGEIDFREFMKLMESNHFIPSADEEIKGLFEAIDTDNDGYITEVEVGEMMKKLGEKVRKKDIRKMVKEADKNKDGKISFIEFKAMVEKFTLDVS